MKYWVSICNTTLDVRVPQRFTTKPEIIPTTLIQLKINIH